MMRRALCVVLACAGLLLAAGCDTARALDNAAINRLVKPMVVRLEIAREVAWSKARSGAPVLDEEREAALLAALVNQGEAAGLAPERVRAFFSAQIAASREVQTELLSAWAAGTQQKPATRPLELRTEIRPRMDAASAALIQALASARLPVSDQRKERVEERLRAAGFSGTVSALAAGGLQ
jgi:chorismate mutase